MGAFSIGGEHGQLDNDHSWWQPNSGKIQMDYMMERTDLALESLFPAKTAAKWGEKWRENMNLSGNDVYWVLDSFLLYLYLQP